MRIATWNLKQAVAPRKTVDELWQWSANTIEPDVIAFTEAKVPKSGVPAGWSAQWTLEGIGPRRNWGTVLAARGVQLEPIEVVRVGRSNERLQFDWPAAVQVADVIQRGERWGTIVGIYALTVDAEGRSNGHGGFSTRRLFRQLEPLFASDKGDRILVGGDLNLLPRDVASTVRRYGLTDLIERTAPERGPLTNCLSCRGAEGCGHLWTHRNGNSPNAAVQQIDYLFATDELANSVTRVYGGAGHFGDAWALSDHAPVVADFGPTTRPRFRLRR